MPESRRRRTRRPRVKVHYFYRVPNHGLYVDISDPHYREDGSFKVLADEKNNADDDNKAPGKTIYVFGTTNNENPGYDNNIPYIIKGDRMLNVTASCQPERGWRVIANAHCECPYCGTKLTKRSKADEDNPDAIQVEEQDGKKLLKFRFAADFISRLIAPSTLDLMTEAKPKRKGKISLHKGQQYISFVDSRQTAAQSTIKQNLEEERLWVYGTIITEFCRKDTAGTRTKE